MPILFNTISTSFLLLAGQNVGTYRKLCTLEYLFLTKSILP